jgi:hypothetical protein
MGYYRFTRDHLVALVSESASTPAEKKAAVMGGDVPSSVLTRVRGGPSAIA